MWSHQSTKLPLEKVVSHIKVTRPPCLFWMLPWESWTQINNSIWQYGS